MTDKVKHGLWGNIPPSMQGFMFKCRFASDFFFNLFLSFYRFLILIAGQHLNPLVMELNGHPCDVNLYGIK